MYTGDEYIEEIKIYKKYVNVIKYKITFKTDGLRGGEGGLLQKRNPTQSTGYLVLT